MLSAPERKARAAIAVKTRFGLDAEPDRRAFAELQATRELHEAAAKLVQARRAQGFADRVDDPGTLARIAALLVEPPRESPQKRIAPAPTSGAIWEENDGATIGPSTTV